MLAVHLCVQHVFIAQGAGLNFIKHTSIQLGPRSQADVIVQRSWGWWVCLGPKKKTKKAQEGNASMEKHSGGFKAEIGQKAWNKLGPQGKGRWEEESNFDVSAAGTEIIQSSFFPCTADWARTGGETMMWLQGRHQTESLPMLSSKRGFTE
jgi:hypothetical protein